MIPKSLSTFEFDEERAVFVSDDPVRVCDLVPVSVLFYDQILF